MFWRLLISWAALTIQDEVLLSAITTSVIESERVLKSVLSILEDLRSGGDRDLGCRGFLPFQELCLPN